MASGFSSVIFNPFEQALSPDLNRTQRLSSRELQDLIKASMRSDQSRASGTSAYVAPSNVLFGSGLPIASMDRTAYLRAAGGFDMELQAGQAFFTLSGVSADDSDYGVARWATQTLTFGAPDPGNPRVDIVYAAAPASVGTDPISRNVLVDPVTRTVVPQLLNKTLNPAATIAISAGTPAASPTPPSPPAGAQVLYEVWIPAAAASSATFVPVPRLWRRAPYPLSAFNGVISGCVPKWTIVDVTSSAAINLSATDVHRVCIDGEILVYSGTVPNAVDDTVNAPGAAGATDKPFYIYLCGGRNNPRRSAAGCPFVLVMSTTAPDAFGHPSAALDDGATIQRGGAVYIGIGFVYNGTSNKISMYVAGDMVYPAFGALLDTAGVAPQAADQNFTLATKPTPSTLVHVSLVALTVPRPHEFILIPRHAVAAVASTVGSGMTASDPDAGSIQHRAAAIIPISTTTPHVIVNQQTAETTGTISLAPHGYNMNVPRLTLGLV